MENIFTYIVHWIEWFFSRENLKEILVYDESSPLIFTKLYFWIFFTVVLGIYAILYKKIALRNIYLLIVSLFFYYKTSGLFVSILIFSTVSDYLLGNFIYRSQTKYMRLAGVTLSICINLFTLGFFKYAYFFTDVYNQITGQSLGVFNWFAYWANEATGTHYSVDQILLPVGISFYTFQTISYTVDIYRGIIHPVKNILDFGFYVSFFPQLVAGPIVRASEFIPQIYSPYQLTKAEFGYAHYMIAKGLIKKLVLGDYIAVNFIDRVFDNPTMFSGFENVMALFGYSLQVYADFSGYTDMAIGVALLMGFRLPQNFNYPYKAKNVAEFWKRWHMSLSGWLKDYLYIPLGGNRKGTLGSLAGLTVIVFFLFFLSTQAWMIISLVMVLMILSFFYFFNENTRKHVVTNINLMITMLLGGLWHGASWQFIIWGGLNGLGLVVYKYWKKISPWENSPHSLAVAWKILLTFTFITFTRAWFRAEDGETVRLMFYQISHHFQWHLIAKIISANWKFFALFTLGMMIHWTSYNFKNRIKTLYENASWWQHVLLFYIAVLIAYQAITADLQPFIYFQF